jgi:hypothetical protein
MSRQLFCPAVVFSALMLLFVPSGTAFADSQGVYIGLDRDGDMVCDGVNDMNVLGMTAGDSVEVSIYWDNTGAASGLFSMNCTVCLENEGMLDQVATWYDPSIPGVWTLPQIQNSTDNPVTVQIDQWIRDCWPNRICYLFQATDFTFGSPIPPGQHIFGTLAFRVAADGDLGMVIDGDPYHTGWFTSGFLSGGCTGGLPQDPQCQCVNTEISCGGTGTADTDWGSIKDLFR